MITKTAQEVLERRYFLKDESTWVQNSRRHGMRDVSEILGEYIAVSKYARWVEGEARRETWTETVDRFIDFFKVKFESNQQVVDKLSESRMFVLNKEVMPSMRAMMTAGKALSRCNSVGYNCAAIAVSNARVFDEIFYLLMGGSGVGFSVERQYINQLPEVAEEMHDTDTTIVVGDSRSGWAKALKELIALLYNGDVPQIDYSKVRPAGSRLKTMGGRASGSEPLMRLFRYTAKTFNRAKGRKLNSLECHDLVCKIAETVIVGSVRRSACISFSNLTDDRMRRAKSGEFYLSNPERFLANNSVMYTEKPDLESFTKEFRSIYKSKAGERGIVNHNALKNKAEECGRNVNDYNMLLNPCAEAILRHTGGLCNLSEIIIRSSDTLDEIKKKAEIATFLGLIQSSLTDFKYLRKVWKDNAEEERLLGVSMTGIMDHSVTGSGSVDCMRYLKEVREFVGETSDKWADIIGINRPTQKTLVKPSGTVSQLCNTSSGIHPRYAEHYVRRVTQDVKDPLTDLMIDEGIPYVLSGDKVIFSFPIRSPEGATFKSRVGAMKQLEIWKMYQDNWCDGNPSCTIYYTDDEFLSIQAWVWENWDSIGGLSFFPVDDNVYENQPFEELTKMEYKEMMNKFPSDINWQRISEFEFDDNREMEIATACAGGACEL